MGPKRGIQQKRKAWPLTLLIQGNQVRREKIKRERWEDKSIEHEIKEEKSGLFVIARQPDVKE